MGKLPFPFSSRAAYIRPYYQDTEVLPMAAKSGKRELIDTGTDKRFVKRDKEDRFEEVVDVGRSLAADRRSKSKTVAKPGYGDQGDQAKRTTKKAAKKTTKKAGKKAAKK
jgi:hypothetical protein